MRSNFLMIIGLKKRFLDLKYVEKAANIDHISTFFRRLEIRRIDVHSTLPCRLGQDLNKLNKKDEICGQNLQTKYGILLTPGENRFFSISKRQENLQRRTIKIVGKFWARW